VAKSILPLFISLPSTDSLVSAGGLYGHPSAAQMPYLEVGLLLSYQAFTYWSRVVSFVALSSAQPFDEIGGESGRVSSMRTSTNKPTNCCIDCHSIDLGCLVTIIKPSHCPRIRGRARNGWRTETMNALH
jgi:hypothetical protein